MATRPSVAEMASPIDGASSHEFLLNATASTSGILETSTQFLINVTAKIEKHATPGNGTGADGDEDQGIRVPKIFNIFEKHPWLVWVFLAALALVVVAVVVTIVCCILHNKKKVIRRGSSQAIFDYDQPNSGCLPCRRFRKSEPSPFARQNSASNMSPYGRNQPLPPLRGLPPRPETSPQPATMGIHIVSIKDVPDVAVPPGHHRPLPLIRPKTS